MTNSELVFTIGGYLMGGLIFLWVRIMILGRNR